MHRIWGIFTSLVSVWARTGPGPGPDQAHAAPSTLKSCWPPLVVLRAAGRAGWGGCSGASSFSGGNLSFLHLGLEGCGVKWCGTSRLGQPFQERLHLQEQPRFPSPVGPPSKQTVLRCTLPTPGLSPQHHLHCWGSDPEPRPLHWVVSPCRAEKESWDSAAAELRFMGSSAPCWQR